MPLSKPHQIPASSLSLDLLKGISFDDNFISVGVSLVLLETEKTGFPWSQGLFHNNLYYYRTLNRRLWSGFIDFSWAVGF